MKKKGTIEIQFNWIFVLIAGGLILLLVTGLVWKIGSQSKESLNFDIITYLDEILTGIQTSVDSEHYVNLVGSDLVIDCYRYNIKDSSYEGNPINNRVIFSPNQISGEMSTFTLYWTLPFKISHFLYLNSPRNKFVLIKDDQDKIFDLNDSLPRNTNKIIIDDISSFRNENYDNIIFIFVDETNIAGIDLSVLDLGKIKDEHVRAVNIFPSSTIPNGVGRIEFFSKSGDVFGSKEESHYINRETLVGAVFSEDKEMYECNVKKALKRLSLMSDVLDTRLVEISSYTQHNLRLNICNPIYDQGKQHLNKIYDKSKTNEINEASFVEIISAVDSLIDVNYELQILSCPLIY